MKNQTSTNAPVNKGQFEFEPEERIKRFNDLMGHGWEDEYKEYVENMGDELTSFEMELVSGGNDCGGGVNDLLT